MATTTTDPSKKLHAIEVGTYTAENISALLQCSKRHIRRMIDGGEIPGMLRIGRLVRFHRGIVNEWLSEQAKGTAVH